MDELKVDFGNLTPLINQESDKCVGILNGIDPQIWDPKTDPMLKHKLSDSINSYKKINKYALCKKHVIYKSKMLVSFIGRLAYEKGADLLATTIDMALEETKDIAFVILGSGDPETAAALEALDHKHKKYVKAIIAYDEKLAHEIYAASDFLVMPSRFEPCGLNQLYAMRYVTVPIARYTGGLKDTVPDISVGGNGISFDVAEEYDFLNALERALKLYKNKKDFYKLQYKIASLDFSWQQSAQNYIHQYSLLINS
jgi:starch synthase